jgi:uncharacterized ubiquitin-like protein YukD
MADQHSVEGSSSSNVSAANSESMVELNIKTLDSQMHNFDVDKKMLVSVFKEKIASQTGVPVGQQRLIFRGKVLKDDHSLSEYHVENGDTLHLVVRQPAQPQPPGGPSTGDTNTNAAGQEGNAAGGGRPRVGPIGQISHSLVLGTFNVGEQGEGAVPDLTRVIGAVLNSIGIGNQTTVGIGAGAGAAPNVQVNASAQAPQGSENAGTQSNAGDQRQAGSQPNPAMAFSGQTIPQVLQIPVGPAMLPLPSLNMPIPDSLNTLSEFMKRMELALSQNGYQPNQSGELPSVELPTNGRGVPSPEALGVVLRHAERLLGSHAVPALSHIAGQLEQESGSTDPMVRNQIQTGSVQVGLAMQHLGALFLELGRTMMTLRMGRSSDESHVNAGPAVYISPSAPNPIMVQPFPLQTTPLFGGPGAIPVNPGPFGPVGVGSVPRHVNIHIHTAVGPQAANGEGRVNGAIPVRNVVVGAVPPHSGAPQHGVSVPPTATDPISLSTQLRNLMENVRTVVQSSPSGQSESSNVNNQSVHPSSRNEERSNSVREEPSGTGVGQKKQAEGQGQDVTNKDGFGEARNIAGSSGAAEVRSGPSDDVSRSSQGTTSHAEGTSSVPLGLGLGGLEPKKRSRTVKPQGKSGDDQNQAPPVTESMTSSSGGGGQIDPASIMSQVINAPALNGLLSGVSQQTGIGSPDALRSMLGQLSQSPMVMNTVNQLAQQIDGQDLGRSGTGVGSPDMLRNMLGQLTQSPAMMDTVNQIAQQMDGQDLGNMFSGLGRGQAGGGGGGIDLSRMIQQMMPIVSQALGGGSAISQEPPAAVRQVQPLRDEGAANRNNQPNNSSSQGDLQHVADRIRNQNPPREIFRSAVESAVRLYNDGVSDEDLVDVLCSEDGLDTEYVEMMRGDISRRLGESREEK